MGTIDDNWVEAVVEACDPIFEAADVGFVRQLQYADERRALVDALLWEADPRRFAQRYPDSGIVETYGEQQWPNVHCIDFWVNVDHAAQRCRLSVEGWNLPELWLDLRGHGESDGAAIADMFARILAVPSPRV
ncbi:hypothetical protein [Nocardioides sp. P5_C9_2]